MYLQRIMLEEGITLEIDIDLLEGLGVCSLVVHSENLFQCSSRDAGWVC